MTRATTPTHCFLFDEDPEEFTNILITYAQGNKVVLEKHKEDLTIEPIEPEEPEDPCCTAAYRAYYRLTQEETNMFSGTPGSQIYVQVRVLTENGTALASEKKLIQLKDVLDDRILT